MVYYVSENIVLWQDKPRKRTARARGSKGRIEVK